MIESEISELANYFFIPSLVLLAISTMIVMFNVSQFSKGLVLFFSLGMCLISIAISVQFPSCFSNCTGNISDEIAILVSSAINLVVSNLIFIFYFALKSSSGRKQTRKINKENKQGK